MSQTRTFKQSRKAIEPERTKQSQREPDRARESHREPDRATESHSWSQLSFDNNEEENVDGAGDRERVGRGRGCSFYLYLPICEFSLFFETWLSKMKIFIALVCWGVSFSLVLFLYSCTVPTLYLNIRCCQPASPLSPLWDIDSELTWHPHPLLPNFLFKKKKGNNDEDDIDDDDRRYQLSEKKRFMTFFLNLGWPLITYNSDDNDNVNGHHHHYIC